MTSLGQATNSFHLPQHTQLLHAHHSRMLEDDPISSFSCTPPPPQNVTYFNPSTNQSLSFEKEIKVHEIGILFNYEIRHSSGVTWGDLDEESSGGIREWTNKAGDFFSNLFSGGDDEEDTAEAEESSESVGDGGAAKLIELENYMASEVWANTLLNEEMTWNENETECMGLLIEEVEINLNEPLVVEGEEEEEEVIVEGGEEEGEQEVADASSQTKLLGLMHQPIDYVSINGCAIPDPTCTAVHGQVSVAYSGTNEYGVVQTVIEQLRGGMEAGTFIPSGSPALNLEFQSAEGTALTSGNTGIIQIKSVRGTEQLQEEEENSDLSQYGTLFVCLVGILGTGFIASMAVRYRKRQRRVKQTDEGEGLSDEDFEANLAMQEQDAGKTDFGGDSSGTDSPGTMNQVEPDSPSVTKQVELELPQVDSNADSNGVEISWSGSKLDS